MMDENGIKPLRKKDRGMGKAPKNRRTTSKYKRMLKRIVAAAEGNDLKTTLGSRKFIRLIREAKSMVGE